METKRDFSELSIEEIRERCSKVTDKQKAETQTRIKLILLEQKEYEKKHRTMEDIEWDLLIRNKPFELVRK